MIDDKVDLDRCQVMTTKAYRGSFACESLIRAPKRLQHRHGKHERLFMLMHVFFGDMPTGYVG